MAQPSEASSSVEIKLTSREISAWGGMALIKRMLDSMNFRTAASQWDLPEPGSNRGYPPVQLIEQLLVSTGCGACRFTHLDITRLDSTLTRLFGRTRVAGHKAIVRLFGRFDMMRHERVQASVYRWFFDTVSTRCSVTLDTGSAVITRHGEQQGAARGSQLLMKQLAIPLGRQNTPAKWLVMVAPGRCQQCQQCTAIHRIDPASSGQQDRGVAACG